MDAAVLGDLIERDRRSDAPALWHPPSGREYDYRRFCTTAWKVGNLLRNEGVRGGTTVAVGADRTPEAVLALYGAGALGADVAFGLGAGRDDRAGAGEVRAIVAPTGALAGTEADPSARLVGYGSEPADPAVAYFERDVWSENPTPPPDRVAPGDALLRVDGRTVSHGEVLAAARSVVGTHGLGTGSVVAVRAPLARPGTVAAGLVAPILAGGGVLLGGDGGRVADGAGGTDATADLTVTTGGAGDASRPCVRPDEVV